MPFTPFLSPFEQCPSVDLVYLGFHPLVFGASSDIFYKKGKQTEKNG